MTDSDNTDRPGRHLDQDADHEQPADPGPAEPNEDGDLTPAEERAEANRTGSAGWD